MNKAPAIWLEYLKSKNESINTTSLKYIFEDHFCYDKESADNLFELVLCGKKRATCSLYLMYQQENEEVLKPGDLSILTNFDNTKNCIIKTTKVIIKKFNEINEEEAKKEGDLSLEYWKNAHKQFFEIECKKMNIDFNEEMKVVFEEFEIEYIGNSV